MSASRRPLAAGLIVAMLALTTACGGGGSDDGSSFGASGGGGGGTGTGPPAASPPSIAYAPATFHLTTGVPFSVSAIDSGGAVGTWSVSPALPEGLTLGANGSIGGTPTAVAAPAAYTVRAANSLGIATATLTIGVESGVLLELGHGVGLLLMLLDGDRLLSVDLESHWALWDSRSGHSLAQGEATCACDPPVALSAPIFTVRTSNSIEVRAATDGRLLTTIATAASWSKLADDGSYVTAGDRSGITAWAPSGNVLFSRPGDYSQARVFPTGSEVRVARGAAGSNVIEKLAIPTGAATMTAAFQGQFHSWFGDGERFLTTLSTTAWVYSADAVQQDNRALSTNLKLGGYGPWFWSYSTNPAPRVLNIYAVGGGTMPVASYDTGVHSAQLVQSGSTLGVLGINGEGTLAVVDLSGLAPSMVQHPLAASAYAALSSTEWIAGDWEGVMRSPALSNTASLFSLGRASSVVGGSSRAVIAVAAGQIIYFDAATKAEQGRLDLASEKLALSDDGRLLVAKPKQGPAAIIELPSEIVLRTLELDDYLWLSASGEVIGTFVRNAANSNAFRRDVTSIGGTSIWSDTSWLEPPMQLAGELPIRLSPSGALVAASSTYRAPNVTTNIFRNGSLVTAVAGWPAGWIDESRLLVNAYGGTGLPDYVGASIVSAAGQQLSSPPLPHIIDVQPIDADRVYAPNQHATYSLTTGQQLWSSPNDSRTGTVAGPFIVFPHRAAVRAERY